MHYVLLPPPNPPSNLDTTDEVTENQMDHELCYIRHATSMFGSGTMKEASTDSDHHLVREGVCRKFDTIALRLTSTAES